MLNNTHIINRVYLEVHTQSKRTGYALKDQLSQLLEQELFPLLENYFNKINEKNLDILQLENLQININVKKQDDYKQIIKSIKENFITSFEKKLNTTGTKEVQLLTSQESMLNSFFVFLEEGVLPWSFSLDQNKEFDKTKINYLSKQAHFKSLFIKKLKKTLVQKRLINQFNDKNIALILKKVFKDHKQHQLLLSEKLLSLIKELDTLNRNFIWSEIINYLIHDNKHLFITKISKIIKSIKKQAGLQASRKEKIITKLSILLNKIDQKNQVRLEDVKNTQHQTISKDLQKQKIEGLQTDIKKSARNPKQTKKENLALKKQNLDKANKTKLKSQTTQTFEKQKKEEQITFNQDATEFIDSVSKKLKQKTDSLENTISEKDLFKLQDKQEYYVQNAGLILLHPFLKQFFKTCELLDNQNKIKDRELAAHLLHYMATKKEKQPESNMVFEKFLCGIPIKQSINREIFISNKLKKQVNDLLQSVLDNWEILKDASIDLLRNEFLQRSGKLSFKADNPKIIIERKTQDILIDKLPWNLSISKLIWIDKIIFTDW